MTSPIVTAAVASVCTGILILLAQWRVPGFRPPSPRPLSSPAAAAVHTGIRLRIWTVGAAGPLIDLDSDALYHLAVIAELDDPCTPRCPPRCNKHGWSVLCPVRLGRVEIRPVWLDNEPAEDRAGG